MTLSVGLVFVQGNRFKLVRYNKPTPVFNLRTPHNFIQTCVVGSHDNQLKRTKGTTFNFKRNLDYGFLFESEFYFLDFRRLSSAWVDNNIFFLSKGDQNISLGKKTIPITHTPFQTFYNSLEVVYFGFYFVLNSALW